MKQPFRSSIALLAGIFLLLASNVMAAGTDAGATISNQATLNFSVGGVSQPQLTSDGDGDPNNGAPAPTTFVVDNRIDLTASGANNAAASGTGQILVFSITNTGNEDQGYSLELFTGANGVADDLDFNNVAIYYDADKSGTVTAGDSLYTSGSGTRVGSVDVPANSGANSTIQILVVGDVPGGAATGQTAAYTLKAFTLNAGTDTQSIATAGADTAAIDVVLADGAAAGGVGGAADAANDGDYYATATYTVQAAQLYIAKTATVISDPVNGISANAKAIPGAIIEYTITITNNGGAGATDLRLEDPIPANTWFVVGSVTAAGSSSILYDANNAGTWSGAPVNGGDSTDHSITDIAVTYAALAASPGPGNTATIKFRVMIQ